MSSDIAMHFLQFVNQNTTIAGIADNLDKVIAGYGITLHTESELKAVDADARSRSPRIR